MKKRSLVLILAVSILMSLNIINVNAANTYVDASTCEGGVIYTNYYFFLDASSVMSKDYRTIGYYSNFVSDESLKTVAKNYGIFSEEFARVANRGFGVVPIDTSYIYQDISVKGIGLKTFYDKILVGGISVSGTNAYLVSHDWSKVQGHTVKESSSKSLTFTISDIQKMINATVMLNNYPTISPISNLSDDNVYPTQIQITRKYSKGTIGNYKDATPIVVEGETKTWNAYLQPALFYVQYCAKKTTNTMETLYYNANAESDTVTNMPYNQAFYSGGSAVISSIIPVRNGYTFLGWNENQNATEASTLYIAGRGVTKTMTLYAVWRKNNTNSNQYTVVYRPNTTDTVSNMPASITKNTNETMNISEVIPVRKGYTFLGWSSKSGATSIEEQYNGGKTYSDRKDLILYAVWKKNTSNSNIPDNPKTGVEEYLIPFGGIIAASGLGLKVLKKKKLYVQF